MLQDIVYEVFAQGVLDHACVPPMRVGARKGAAEHPPRCHCGIVLQGVRSRCEGAYAEMSTLAASGAVLIIRYVCVRLSYSSPYRMLAPVDHTYYNKYSRG